MHQHAWAAQRLWEGLIGPSEAAWSDGRNELNELTVDRELSPALRPQLAKIHNLAQPLPGNPDDVQRGDRYAAIIATCGECHGVLGVGP
jgi:mono/diheme cytochrome c family protein